MGQWDFILDHLEGNMLQTPHANGDKAVRGILFRHVEQVHASGRGRCPLQEVRYPAR